MAVDQQRDQSTFIEMLGAPEPTERPEPGAGPGAEPVSAGGAC
jgi:hypothetical protein